VTALRDVHLTVPAGAVVAVLGPSGSGKSTLGEVLAGTIAPDAGSVHSGETDISGWPPQHRRISLAPQEWHLFPHLTAGENVAFGPRVAGIASAACWRLALDALARVGLADRARALPHQLSGGQQQRVALARALAAPTTFAVLDEPFSSVDMELRPQLRALVREAAGQGKGIVFITHDRQDAIFLADRVVCLVDGEVAMTGTPEEVYRNPVTLRVASLTGDAFALPGSLVESLAATSPSAVPDAVVAGICRPEWLELIELDDGKSVPGTVTAIQFAGSDYLVDIQADGAVVQARSRAHRSVRSTVGLRVRRGLAHGRPMPGVEESPIARQTVRMK
jgi:iron(III) transport system ATP-binding protein